MPSYFERAEWHELGSLDQAATLEALTEPAAAAGRPFEPAAAAELASETGGYPYAIQLYGHHAWRASAGQDRITLDAARQAAKTGGAQLERGLYAQRWAQASPREQQYLLALASQHAEGQTMNGGAVARRLGVTPAQLGLPVVTEQERTLSRCLPAGLPGQGSRREAPDRGDRWGIERSRRRFGQTPPLHQEEARALGAT
jgi:hypothetical protein